ncbi:MBL fold metallo-hydrolase [Poseidonocella sp. HB161398]|uniref:MBL fold metallo-hydrolase n=1 Tax=Poseidonocella sp. HB161398 TaxID=2320855 RepID=UPI00110947C7|nr:MBL fold metallo-hydrolase [Poseidonocella sp. HB161398]
MESVAPRSLPPSRGAVTVTNLGVSGLLIDDGATQIVIDGFLTRPDKGLLSPMAPDLKTIRAWLNDNRMRAFHCAVPAGGGTCTEEERRGVSLVVAAHGHYDHALDTPTVAALTGSWLVRDDWIDEITRASEAYFGNAVPAEAWAALRSHGLASASKGSPPVEHRAGAFTVTLIPTLHVDYPGVRLLRGVPDVGFSFPTRLFAMKEGNSLSVHVAHPAGSLLVVPTFGVPEAPAERLRAEVVFLGIGFAGWKEPTERIRVWQQTVGRSGAHRVVLTHWDNNKGSISAETGGALKPLGVLRLDRSWKSFCALASGMVDMRFAPAGVAVDPFIATTAPSVGCP